LAAAALAGGVYAYGKHKKGKAEEEEEVSPLLHFSDFPLLTIVEEPRPPTGISFP